LQRYKVKEYLTFEILECNVTFYAKSEKHVFLRINFKCLEAKFVNSK